MKREELLARRDELRRTKTEIIAKLMEVHALESRLEDRIKAGFKPVLDETGHVLTEAYLEAQMERLASELMADARVKNPLLISVMDGALPFAGAIQKILAARGYHFQFATMQVSSYVGTSAGELTISSPPKIPVGARDVIIVDDVCDTGHTAAVLSELFMAQGAHSVQLMALVDKVQPRASASANPSFTGVRISKDAFIAGFGMDYEGLLRNVPGIAAVDLATLPIGEELASLKSKKHLNKELQACLTAIKVVESELLTCMEEAAVSPVEVSPGLSRDGFFAARDVMPLGTKAPETETRNAMLVGV